MDSPLLCHILLDSPKELGLYIDLGPLQNSSREHVNKCCVSCMGPNNKLFNCCNHPLNSPKILHMHDKSCFQCKHGTFLVVSQGQKATVLKCRILQRQIQGGGGGGVLDTPYPFFKKILYKLPHVSGWTPPPPPLPLFFFEENSAGHPPCTCVNKLVYRLYMNP